MPERATGKERHPIGHAWLRRGLGLPVPASAVESYIVAGARRTETRGSRIVELYPRQYAADGSVVSHLRFALRHEPLDHGPAHAEAGGGDAPARGRGGARARRKPRSRRSRPSRRLSLHEGDTLLVRHRGRDPDRLARRAVRGRAEGGAGFRPGRQGRPGSPAGRYRRSPLCGVRLAPFPRFRRRDRRRIPRGGAFHLPAARGHAAPHGWLDGHDAARRRRRRRPRRGGGGLRLRLRLHPPVRGRERPYPPLPDASRARQERLQPARRDLPDIGGHSARPARLRCGTRDLLAAALRVHPLALDFRPGDRRRERDVRSLPLFRRDRVRRIPVRPRGRHRAPGSRGRARLHRGLRPGVRGGARDRGHAGPPGLPVRAPLHAERGRLSAAGRRGFPELEVAEVAAMEAAVREAAQG